MSNHIKRFSLYIEEIENAKHINVNKLKGIKSTKGININRPKEIRKKI